MCRVPAVVQPRRTTLSRTSEGRPLPRLADRFRPVVDGESRWVAWGWPLAVAVLALLLRLWQLQRPHRLLFDETYYAKDAYSLLQFGYVRNTVERADDMIARGELTGLFASDTSYYVHPDVGKWLIALGEWAFGMGSFGWRFSAAVVGALTVLVLTRLARRLTGSTLLGCVAGLLLCFDGLHFVMSRLALLDVFMAFFLVCAAACLVADRDWGRARMLRLVERDGAAVHGWGPVRAMLVRPWRLAAGVSFGLACGTKWNAVFALAGFGLLVWAWDCGARRALGVRAAAWKATLADAVPAFVSLVAVALLVYVSSWAGWLANVQRYESDFGSGWGGYFATDASGPAEAVQSLRSLWNYHQDVWSFHTELEDRTHPYQSDPAGWLVINRPVGVDANSDIRPGELGCQAADKCIEQILAIGTPVLWWAGVLALLAATALWVGGRDWRYGVALVGVLSSWLPWLRFSERPIFYFYAVAVIPFTIVAVTLLLGRILGPADASPSRRSWGAAVAGTFVALVIANFAFFYPILTDGLLTNEQWLDRMWFVRWI
ncbi:MAG: phospholipid carrier-dependent glycosyltransferase [Actinomycetota bacterium]|nr:phospholipid carrier-dependent glycosyltransferase [Actinomycetota bacterium]